MKILAPAGNFESLEMAVFNGADEVYLGINSFNARNNIDGFNMDNLIDAVDFAHLFSVKVNLAINILFTDSEMQSALDTVVDAFNMGVDSFIIQDAGLIKLIHDNFPEITIHASTQMGIHNLEGVKFLEKLGVKRVVLARETPLSEIKRIKENSDMEIEYFAHGALCVCFSGNCYMSSYLFSASGNRGRCKQLCRLPYTLKHNGRFIKKGHLLSAKDFNMIKKLRDLENAGVDVIKIEGRARRPYYVGVIVREYYKALNGGKWNEKEMELAFNRGFTEGYFNGNSNIISTYNNHVGINAGIIEKVNYGKNFNEVFISSDRELYPKSSFKAIDGKGGQVTFSAFDLKKIKDNLYRLTTTHKLVKGDKINLISDYNDEQKVLSVKRRKQICTQLFIEKDKPLKAIITVDGKKISVFGAVAESAVKQPLTIEEINGNFMKGEFLFSEPEIKILDNVFVPKKCLNDFRRKVFSAYENYIREQNIHSKSKIKIENNYKIKPLTDFFITDNLTCIPEIKNKNIIYSPEEYTLDDIIGKKKLVESAEKNFYLDLPVFALENDILLLDDIIKKTGVKIVVNNYYALNFNAEKIIGAGLNIYNSYSAEIFDEKVLTAELSGQGKIDFPVMTLRHCPLKEHTGARCDRCTYDHNYTINNDNNVTFALRRKKLSTCTFYLIKTT